LTLVDSHTLVAVTKLLNVTRHDAVAVVNRNCPVVRHANPLVPNPVGAVAISVDMTITMPVVAVVLVVSRFCRACAAHKGSQTYNGGKQ
jgi:hypothetical protein